MKKHVLIAIAIVLCINIFPQKKNAELADFSHKGTFSAKRAPELRSMNDGIHYTVVEDKKKIVKYAYETGKRVEVIIDLENLRNNSPIDEIGFYQFSPEESRILVYANRENIYRRSFIADYYVIDIQRREIEPLSTLGKQQQATFSPDGNNVAFVRNNNIFLKKLRFGTESPVTTDGVPNSIINGLPDWVYEEEFDLTRAFEWSPDSEEIAFIRFDETNVKEYSLTFYNALDPASDDYSLYPTQQVYKYPKAGEENSKISVHVFNTRNRTTKRMDVGNLNNDYIPRIFWTKTEGQLAIVKMNRMQNQLELFIVNSNSGVGRVIFTDRNNNYVSANVLDDIIFLEDGKHFVYVGELDGYNHIHLYGTDGRKIRQVTTGKWDVTAFYGFDDKKKLFYFQAAVKSPLRREIYSIRMDGSRMTPIADAEGTNNAFFSTSHDYFINRYCNTTTPPIFTLHNSAGKRIRVIENNDDLTHKLNEYNILPKEFFKFTTSEGIELNGWMIKPKNFNPNKKYPVLMTQYSGPNSQSVLDRWQIGWEQYLAYNDILVVCVDGRGTGARGEDFRKSTYMKLGHLESDDQIETAKYLAKQSYVDKNRIAIWGWSYGGFMSALCMSRSDLFKVGIAIAPVTTWRFYDTVYTERFMRRPQENASGYNQNSPLNLAENLKGRLFLIHGSADDNVHVQNTLEYANKLIQADKQFDMFIYPNRNHNINSDNSRKHLYQMKFDYLMRYLVNE